MQLALTFIMQRASHDSYNVAVQERKATCRIIASAESSTCYCISPIKNWCLPYQQGDVATVATMQMIYLRALYICYVKSDVYRRHCPHAYMKKKAINGSANHITNYWHLTFEGY